MNWLPSARKRTFEAHRHSCLRRARGYTSIACVLNRRNLLKRTQSFLDYE